MNKELLLRIKEQILKEPEQFLMRAFFSPSNEFKKVKVNCGTAACIAGWAIALDLKTNPMLARQHCLEEGVSYILRAQSILGITEDQAEDLFSTPCWPIGFYQEWKKASSQQEMAEIAGRRIDYFIEYGK